MINRCRLAPTATAALFAAPLAAQTASKPAALTADGVPAIPPELATTPRPSMEFRTANGAFLENTQGYRRNLRRVEISAPMFIVR
uniref:hypothetical protein n=1 Tax=uncultured Sphingomonas sp. TaxID=158754 RepID=UPI0025D3E24E|nr:hypothetical protein [uncultured Sphingomonas sp.]